MRNTEARKLRTEEEQIPRSARDDREEQVPRRSAPRDDTQDLGMTAAEMSVVEAKMAGGGLVESPANGTLSGRK